ncbi:YSIRK-targeted surface antigen transcriptional regulator [Chlamydia trachomatis]|nr:YSIRK-targeted surface antigen transcriptional regulator [Chlamydia trachomatis]
MFNFPLLKSLHSILGLTITVCNQDFSIIREYKSDKTLSLKEKLSENQLKVSEQDYSFFQPPLIFQEHLKNRGHSTTRIQTEKMKRLLYLRFL